MIISHYFFFHITTYIVCNSTNIWLFICNYLYISSRLKFSYCSLGTQTNQSPFHCHPIYRRGKNSLFWRSFLTMTLSASFPRYHFLLLRLSIFLRITTTLKLRFEVVARSHLLLSTSLVRYLSHCDKYRVAVTGIIDTNIILCQTNNSVHSTVGGVCFLQCHMCSLCQF